MISCVPENLRVRRMGTLNGADAAAMENAMELHTVIIGAGMGGVASAVHLLKVRTS